MAAKEIGKAVYSIFTSPHHAPQKDHLPTLIVCPAGKPQHILYVFMHTNYNQENYLLTPSDAGDLCVAKLFPPHPDSMSSGSSSGHGHGSSKAVRCEASRNLRWSIVNTGVAMPTYKLTLPNPDGGEDQPLIQISKTNKNSPFWTMTYYVYAGHLIPPNRVEFGRVEKSDVARGGDGGTRVVITGKTEEQKAVWKTLGEGNEDMVEWCVLCGALNVIDDEVREAARVAGAPIRPPPLHGASYSSQQPSSSTGDRNGRSSAQGQRANARDLHPTGRSLNNALGGLSIAAAPQANAPPSHQQQQQRPPIQKARSFEGRPREQPPPPHPGSGRAPSPMARPQPSMGPSARGYGPPNGYDGRTLMSSAPSSSSAPSLDQRRPSPQPPFDGRSMAPSSSSRPSMASSRQNSSTPSQASSHQPSQRLRGNSADPRLYGPPSDMGPPQARDGRTSAASYGPSSTRGPTGYEKQRPPPDPTMRSGYDGRGPPSFDPDSSNRPPRPTPPPGLRNGPAPSMAASSRVPAPSMAPSSRAPSAGPSARGYSPPRAPTQASAAVSRGYSPSRGPSQQQQQQQQQQPRERSATDDPQRHARTSSNPRLHERVASGARHERTLSLEAARNDLRSLKSAAAPSVGPAPSTNGTTAGGAGPDHRRQPGREPSTYQPGGRRFDNMSEKPSASPTSAGAPSPGLPYDRPEHSPSSPAPPPPPAAREPTMQTQQRSPPSMARSQPAPSTQQRPGTAPTLRSGVTLQDVPASRSVSSDRPPSSLPLKDEAASGLSAADRIKAQRLARARQASAGSS